MSTIGAVGTISQSIEKDVDNRWHDGYAVAMKTGPLQLRAWMDRLRLSYRPAGKMLGIHWAYLHQLVNGQRSPSLAVAGRIQTLTGVPIGAWMPTDVAGQRHGKKTTARSARVGRK